MSCNVKRMYEVVKLKQYITVDKNGSIDLSWLAQQPTPTQTHRHTSFILR